MNALPSLDALAFIPSFLAGMLVNFEIAGMALGLGLAAGGLLVMARLRGGFAGGLSGSLVALMRAAPTFVVMFFLLNALPGSLALSGAMIVALSLVPYSAAYIADSGADALRQRRAGSHLASLLFFPNVMRAFFVLVMSSGAGAAIGVREGITVLLHQAERLPALGDKLVLFAIGVACFGIPLQIAFGLTRLVQRHLSRRAAAYGSEAAATLAGE
jgi:ABC-type amino acid transport system permease subunit